MGYETDFSYSKNILLWVFILEARFVHNKIKLQGWVLLTLLLLLSEFAKWDLKLKKYNFRQTKSRASTYHCVILSQGSSSAMKTQIVLLLLALLSATALGETDVVNIFELGVPDTCLPGLHRKVSIVISFFSKGCE